MITFFLIALFLKRKLITFHVYFNISTFLLDLDEFTLPDYKGRVHLQLYDITLIAF